jgi:beta-1,4-mannosyltransferase
MFVTGKGPMKEFYQDKISRLQLRNISIHTLWLTPSDYPLLLACADLGVSLHTSTSGLDLPMKVLDLYGCETPVCAMGFKCLDELLQDKVTGRIFTTSDELADQLDTLLRPIPERAGPHGFGDLATYSANLKGRQRWSENWKVHALPLLAG